ncbi:hypothetical protein FGO68_gene1212 [Halteria grandinella]|uniref:Uncharacterized protein n=1 Tax=Halteria grandinella TaxID=5974 RepID=A0A8J8T2Z1_HALGN|nr:hypothetical protein FGO68_gene1212 [Halteria grandinella]
MLLPGVGSLIGTVVGGLAGGLAGDKLMLRQYQDLENRLDHLHLIMQSQIMPSRSTDEAYKEALLLLNSNENDELLTIENRFFEKQHYTSEQLFSAKKAKNELLSKLQQNELESLYEAYKIVRSRKHYVSTKEGAGAETSSLTEAFKME